MPQRVLITGSSGLVGSECVRHFDRLGFQVFGLDGNQRRDFFGIDGDVSGSEFRLAEECLNASLIEGDIRDRDDLDGIVERVSPQVIIHCAAQPSHDLAAKRPFDDFETNAVGTLNLLEATRRHVPDATFIFCSTNKVYGDSPNCLALQEMPTRWEFRNVSDHNGIDESMSIDGSRHSLFGVSKAAADLMVQEYGRTFGMKTACFRMGCITGSAHAAAEQHGFLAYLARCIREDREYKIYGYLGKQVRDNLHAADVASAFAEFAAKPRVAEVYNLGGGKQNSLSVREAIVMMENASGKRLRWEYVNEARGGDHICYYSDTSKFRSHYPGWKMTRNLQSIVREFFDEPESKNWKRELVGTA